MSNSSTRLKVCNDLIEEIAKLQFLLIQKKEELNNDSADLKCLCDQWEYLNARFSWFLLCVKDEK